MNRATVTATVTLAALAAGAVLLAAGTINPVAAAASAEGARAAGADAASADAARVGGAASRAAPGAVRGLATWPHGARSVTLTWEPAAHGAWPVTGYRILRGRKAGRRTTRRSVRVRIPSRRSHRALRLRVVAVDGAGRRGRATGSVIVRAGHRRPSRPVAPTASDVNETSATLSWRRSRSAGGRIAAYRVVRDGRTVRRVKRTHVRVKGLRSGATKTFRIIAVDSLGWTSRRSQAVTITAGHRPPAPPGAPTATSVTDTTLALSWQRGALPAGSQLRGYRLMRDGQVVGQVPAERADVGNLAPKSAHDWTVAAVDTRGYVSAPSPATHVVQGDPPPTAGGVHAFLLASTGSSFAAFRAHYRQISVVYPTFYDCAAATGLVEGGNDARIVSYAQDRKVKVLPRFNCQRTDILHRILTDPVLREHWLASITALADQNGWDGVNIDFESIAAADRDLLTAFIADLSGRLHAQGKLLSQAVSGKVSDVRDHPRSSAFDYEALARYDDYVFVMAWGIHWAASAPGAQDDFTWVRQVRDYVATMPLKQKFVMGTMLYGMDWPAGGQGVALHYAEIEALIARYGATPVFDPDKRAWHLTYTDASGVAHDVWYSDASAVGDRVALAAEQGLKSGFWRIGQEDERIWSDPRLPAGG
jgi:spore germination protein YaaH